MNIQQIAKTLSESGIEQNEAVAEAKILVEACLGLNSTKLAIDPEFEPLEDLLKMIEVRVTTHKPIQYITGKAYFMGDYYKVNENVLIPRDETEILVRKAIDIVKKNDFKKILDIGTGSGCIACSIAKNTDAQVIGLDISSDALQIALDNSSALNLYNKAIFRKSDIYSNIKNNEVFDLIVSNPPYVLPKEREKIQQEVSFEPELALYANDEDGLDFYKRIIKDVKVCLKSGGYLAFELGIGESQGVKTFMEEHDFCDIEIIKDFAYIDRVIVGRLK